jgi:hypothetical protein
MKSLRYRSKLSGKLNSYLKCKAGRDPGRNLV